jgi:iron complex outermembrane receptor protein
VHYAKHTRIPRTASPAFVTSRRPAAAGGSLPYPSDFGDGLNGGNWDNTGFTYAPEE